MGNSVNRFAAKSEAAISRSNRAFRRLTPALGNAAKQFLSFASAAAIGTGIVATIGFSTRALMDYETAIQSAMAITGKTGDAFIPFEEQIKRIAKETKKSSVDIAKAFEVVGSEKPELLENAEALGAVTESVITLSKASRDELDVSAKNLTGTLNQFSLGADQAERVMNVLAAGAKVGSANITQVSESMKNFGTVAASSNLSVEQSVALIELMAQFGVKGAESGTKLKGTLLKLQKAGVGYASGQFDINDALSEMQTKLNGLSTAQEKNALMQKVFGAENVSTGQILLGNVDAFENLTKGVTGTQTAYEMAEQNSNTLSNRLDELKNAWVNMLTGANGAGSALDRDWETVTPFG